MKLLFNALGREGRHMRKTKEQNWTKRTLAVVASLALALVLALVPQCFSMVSHAQSQGKVIATSAKIRKTADAGSEVIGSATKDAKVTINNQVTASDNTVWYQVFVNADTLGYIRSDLVEITDGTTPPTASATTAGSNETATTTTTTNQNVNETPVAVTAVEPMSASVTGGQAVRVRSNASTTSAIVTTVQSGLALTVNGQAAGTDGKTWYQVNFIANGQDVTGFIRSDFVALSGELVPAGTTETDPGAEEMPQEPETPAEPEVTTKDWDTQYDADTWYLVDNVKEERYKIDNIFGTLEELQTLYDSANSNAKSRLVIVIVLVILLVALAGAVAYLFLKMKDMTDSAYFNEVERDTVRRRTADRPRENQQKVMHTVGTNATAARPAGARPAAPGQGRNVRPAGARPAAPGQGQNARPAGARPAAPGQGQSVRPAGARPAAPGQGQNARPAVARPAAPGQGQNARPAGARPAAPGQGQSVRPAGARPAAPGQGQNVRPAGARPAAPGQGQNARPAGTAQTPTPRGNEANNSGWKSKNFMTDDDEFEFEFLNWDGDDEQ